jgi:hypothetical protein
MGIKEEEVQAKEIHNIFNKIIAKNFPNIKKELIIQGQEAYRTPNRLDQNRTSHGILSLKRLAQKQRRNIEVCKREKNNI